MTLTIHKDTRRRLGHEELSPWLSVPVAVIGDELNRGQIMQAAIKPLAPDNGFVGQALTVRAMVGDNLAIHHALARSSPGDVIVADARGHEDTAVWGGVMQTVAETKRLAAVIIDGAVRDAAELQASDVPVYCRAVVPAGPHKGFGGEVNGPIQCAGVGVHPGDLVVGDDDGVIVIRLDQLDGLLERCRARIKSEEALVANIRAGKSTIDLMNLPPADVEEN